MDSQKMIAGTRGLSDLMATARAEAEQSLREVAQERTRLKAERRDVERAPVPKAEALAALDRTLEEARAGLPGLGELLDGSNLTFIDRIDPRDAKGMDATAALGFEMGLLQQRMERALLGLCADQIGTIYRAQLEEHYGQPNLLTLTAGQKAKRLREIDAAILDCWRITEAILRATEASGIDLPRDRDMPAEILLAADSELPR